MVPWDLAGEASGAGSSAEVAVAGGGAGTGAAVSLSAFEADGSTGGNGRLADEYWCA